MKTKQQMRGRAQRMAEGFFYCDDDCDFAWQPFEDFSPSELKLQVDDLAESIYQAMIWSQENDE